MREQADLHYDVTGKFGGENAVISHAGDKMYIYLRIGEYYEVGLWPNDYAPSQWNICEEYVNFSNDPTLKKLLVSVWCSIRFICKKYRWYGAVYHIVRILK